MRVRPEAELDLEVAAGWYEARRRGFGAEFYDELSQRLDSLADSALLYEERFSGVRRLFSRRFPYAIYYRILDDEVVVIAILHMRRRSPP